jgi:4-hydroxythreonine-4-phosphate dehydrogenase
MFKKMQLSKIIQNKKMENHEQDKHSHPKTETPIPKAIITHGDTNGIGYEVIMKALSDNRVFDFINPVVYGNSKLASYHKKTVDLPNFNFNLVKNIDSANPKKANILNIIEEEVKVELGHETPLSGKMAFLSLEKAVQDILKKKSEILITAPVHKNAVQAVYPNFTGHTEFLAEQLNSKEILMIMSSRLMRIALATTHVAIADVPKLITTELLIRKLYLFYQSLIQDFNIDRPKIAVLGLNPHASDGGLFGKEEIEVITPAIKELHKEGMEIFGPFPADGFFGNMIFKDFDGILAMYHDQALIPFKSLSFDDGVNFTAGLPIVRTSPAHGTAFDIAGKNMASANSFINALLLAAEIHTNRTNYIEYRKNRLDSDK